MRPPVLAVLLLTLLSLAAPTIWVPVRVGVQRSQRAPQTDIDLLVARRQRPIPGIPKAAYDEVMVMHDHELRVMRGERAYLEPGWPPRYVWMWERDTPEDVGYETGSDGASVLAGEFTQWSVVFLEQALILLLGGGLLTLVVRRERRRKATA